MRLVRSFPHEIREIPTLWIPMRDGRRLAARVWLPEDADTNPVPALVEYLPYRRRDGTSDRDLLTHPWMAGHGYASLRIDLRGTGDSEGILRDEYDVPEQEDGAEAVEWIARQPWCSGSVGMWGISWGGFNSLQVAALAPPALKAIIPIGFAHDRYGGDCHFMGGCALEGNISWGNTFFAGTARPPDPESFGANWREQWLERLEATQHPVATWLSHQRRDDYWKPGSVCEDYARIRAAVYAVSGWLDSYSRNVFPLLEGLSAPKKALIGPWAHAWPHIAHPGPAIGFLQEARRWWDHWLKGIDTGIMDEPMVRVWMQDHTPPRRQVPHWPGRWVGEASWPPDRPAARYAFTADGLVPGDGGPIRRAVCSPLTTGLSAGYQCSYGAGADLADDQRADDGTSACFDTEPLRRDLEILGEAAVELDVSCDEPQAMLAVRLCSVAPDGASLRVSYGLLNLSHRDGSADPRPLEPGRRYRVRIPIMAVAHRFPPGHRLRIAVSTAYWPIAWPSPRPATVTLRAGRLLLPERPADAAGDARLRPFEEAEGAEPLALVETRRREADRPLDRIVTDPATGEVAALRTRDRGAWRTRDTNVSYDALGVLRFLIHPGDPLSASQDFALTTTVGREGWRTRTQAFTRLSCTGDAFRLEARLEAFHEDERLFVREWDESFPRDNV